jgi:hypothetical protein
MRIPPLAWALALAAALLPLPAAAQHNHHLHHNVYQNWVNKENRGCCNNQDCGELAEADERSNGAGAEVRVEGVWCPVKSHMYLKTGNAPNWSTSHACVLRGSLHPGGPCDRLICYQPKPGS